MEPAAPGTEDDVLPSEHQSYSKKASEQERLLCIETRLPSGKYGKVFELTFSNGAEHWYCNLCECPIMGRVYHHEIGKRHTNNMQVAGNSVHHVTPPEPEPPLLIAPGEPVPPGFEDEFTKVAQIQDRLDGFTIGPLIGLEYLFELHEYDRDKEPSYLCVLCNKRGDPRTVIAHLGSYNHIMQYVQRHFVACYRALLPYITKQYKRNWQSAMLKIAEAIEAKFGRLKPHVVDQETFEAKRVHYQNTVASGPHFSEKTGYTFEHLVNKEELTKIIEDDRVITKPSEDVAKRPYRKSGTVPGTILPTKALKRSPSPPVVAKPKKPKPAAAPITEKRRSLSSVSSISSSDLSDFEPDPVKTNEPEKIRPKLQTRLPEKRYRSRSRSPNRRYGRSPPPRKGSFDKFRGRNLPPWQRPDYIRPKNDFVVDSRSKPKTDKFEEFKKLAVAIDADMEKTFKQHEKNPEKHPQYNDEWKKFWNRRYKELQSEGKNAVGYDFKPEWIEFWNKKLAEIHSIEIKMKKDALRKRLGLPEEPAPICFKITGKKKPGEEEEAIEDLKPIASNPDQDSDVIIIDDRDDDEDTVSSKRSRSPWEDDGPGSSKLSFAKHRDKMLDRSRTHRSRDREPKKRYDRSPERDMRKRERDSRSRDIEYHEYRRERDLPYYRESYRKPDLPLYIKPPRVMRDVTRHPVHSPGREGQSKIDEVPEVEDGGDVNVVSILRLLTALEEKLGSLGPKIIDLLAQALAMEKNEANSSETLLENDLNCVLFETVKEKLKGQLIAGFVDYTQHKAFKNAIHKIANLLHYANERNRQREKGNVDPVKVPGVGTVDKSAIAKQIATALIMQGKTDVTQAELEQLINAVVGMAEASRDSNKPLTTASFLEQCNLQNSKKETKIETTFTSLQHSLQLSSNSESIFGSMEGLSDSDLQTLLQNFKDLCTEEQHSLISYLKKLEAKEPDRVERLRKFVSLDPNSVSKKPETVEASGRTSPFATRLGALNPTVEENSENEETVEKEKDKPNTEKKPMITIDSDDEYSFEDVFNAASKNVKEKELEKEKKLAEEKKAQVTSTEVDLTDAKALIASLMGQFGTKNSLSGPRPTPTAADIASKLDSLPLNIANLTNIVNTANASSKLISAATTTTTGTATTTSSILLNLGNFGRNTPNVGSNTSDSGHGTPNVASTIPNILTNVAPNVEPRPVLPVAGHTNLNVAGLAPNMRQGASSIAQGPANVRQGIPSMVSNVPQTVQYPQRHPNMQPYNMNQNISYPQQQNVYQSQQRNIQYGNQPNPNNFDIQRYDHPNRFNVEGNNPNVPYNRPDNNYADRW